MTKTKKAKLTCQRCGRPIEKEEDSKPVCNDCFDAIVKPTISKEKA